MSKFDWKFIPHNKREGYFDVHVRIGHRCVGTLTFLTKEELKDLKSNLKHEKNNNKK